MSLSNRWNSLSRLNRTRILVVLGMATIVAALITIPLVLFSNVV